MAMRQKEKPKNICNMYQGPPQPPPQTVPMPYIVNNNTPPYPNGNMNFPPTAQQNIPPTAYPQQVPFPSQPQGGQFPQPSPEQQVFNQPPQVTQTYHNTAQNTNATGWAKAAGQYQCIHR
ncbi:AIS_collapsed_G0006690.mRNA.1.CDS.1 [Saccharomyces cerevisiae]|nr:AIS_collapsed_G0006690.mRNA.1.CDS.1 [Saccharomyces cerevisiae]